MIFGGAVIAGIMRESISLVYVVPVGIFAALTIAFSGFLLIKQTIINKTNKNKITMELLILFGLLGIAGFVGSIYIHFSGRKKNNSTH